MTDMTYAKSAPGQSTSTTRREHRTEISRVSWNCATDEIEFKFTKIVERGFGANIN